MTLSDPTAPEIASGPSGTLFGGGWLRGTLAAQVTGRDATGIKSLVLTRDGGSPVRTDARTCDYTYPLPCTPVNADVTSSWAAIDTSVAFTDGSHPVTAEVTDAAGNTTASAVKTVHIDNTAPVAPVSLKPSDEKTWSTSPMRTVQWVNPGGQAAPITAATVSVCKDGGGCFSPAATTTQSSFALPGEGLFTVSVKLVDAAGNTTVTPATTEVGYDATAPSAPSLGTPANPAGDGNFEVPTDTAGDAGPAPIVSLTGEACPADGGTCEPISSVGSPPDRATTFLPDSGSWTFTIRAVDASGNTSPSSVVAVDYTAPPAVTPTPTQTPQQTATAMPTGTAIVTEMPTVSPTPTATPAARRKPPLTIARARLLSRRVVIRGVLSEPATGTVAVRVRARKRTVTKRVRLRAGAFVARVRLKLRQCGAKRARVVLRYGGDRHYAPRTERLTLRR